MNDNKTKTMILKCGDRKVSIEVDRPSLEAIELMDPVRRQKLVLLGIWESTRWKLLRCLHYRPPWTDAAIVEHMSKWKAPGSKATPIEKYIKAATKFTPAQRIQIAQALEKLAIVDTPGDDNEG